MFGQDVEPFARVDAFSKAISDEQFGRSRRLEETVQKLLHPCPGQILQREGGDHLHRCEQEGGIVARVGDAPAHVLGRHPDLVQDVALRSDRRIGRQARG